MPVQRPEKLGAGGGIRFSIDRGGTFTDVYAVLPDGEVRVVKLLSEDPRRYPDAPREGIRRILESVSGVPVPADQVDAADIAWIRMGTTVATNALLERKGTRHALLVTQGFKDLLRIGNQARPDIFDLVIEKPGLLYDTVIEVDERIRPLRDSADAGNHELIRTVTGERFVRLRAPDLADVARRLADVFASGITSVAVVFMHAYCFPDHERAVGDIARKIGFTQVSLSHEVMPRVGMVSRGDTTTVDAFLTPHIRSYIHNFRAGFKDRLAGTRLLFMQSDGGLVPADRFKGGNAILSGPAGGVVGYAMTTVSRDAQRPVIGFDMGGTSTDVSRFGGDYELVHETEAAGVRIQAPQMNIVTVAAGGGSRLFFRNGMFVVGPESAGAHPGPACYRKGGHLALTDANLFLGRLQPDYFPMIFGEAEDQPLDRDASAEALLRMTAAVNKELAQSGGRPMRMEEVALGFLRVANETMIRSIREISVMRGYDVAHHVLACFGGAGGQHACAIARELGIREVFIHRHAGILSAYGMGLADVVVERQAPAAVSLDSDTLAALERRLDLLEAAARKELTDQGYPGGAARVRRYLNLRYQGTNTAIMMCPGQGASYAQAFRDAYLREFGFDLPDRKILVDDIRVRAAYTAPGPKEGPELPKKGPVSPVDRVPCCFETGWIQTPLFRLEDLGRDFQVTGPAILMQATSTVVVEPGCGARLTKWGDIRIVVGRRAPLAPRNAVDPVRLSLFSHLFMSVAEQMGRTLQKTAISTNIKERLDFSCAVFDREGRLVANAPHVPVHLGAMGETVRWQIDHWGKRLKEGDVLMSNHPAAGGSHLPDITVITPVWIDGRAELFVASRGHHADVGGISPGSMPAFSKRLKEEGAAVHSFKLVAKGRFNEKAVTALLLAPGRLKREAGAPSIAGARGISDNLSDLKAQVAANHQGVLHIRQMVQRYSLGQVQVYVGHIQDNAEQAVRGMLKQLSKDLGLQPVDQVLAEDFMDDGSAICLKLTLDRTDGSAVFDFTESGEEVWGNWNAPRAVVCSAVLYALRSILRQDIPLNAGCLKPVAILLSDGSLLSPSQGAAVAGGNVLTSQRIVDVVFKAFRAVAASQGCMNNLTFGNDHVGYYETIGGGAGAGPGWDGQSGVHTHMTNTRITDPEVLERRYPVMLREFSLRSGSGGDGAHRGGDGLVREIVFLEKMEVSILSERRVFAPYGLEGGRSGKRGKNLFIHADGSAVNLGGKNAVAALPGDRIRICTPGGGGFGICGNSG